MSITITCQARIMTTFSPKLAIRLNKKYVAEVGNKETIALDFPNNMTLLSYQFLDYPNIKVSNGDHIIIKRNYITLTIRWAYILIYFFFIYFFKKTLPSTSLINTFLGFSIIPIALLPSYRFIKE